MKDKKLGKLLWITLGTRVLVFLVAIIAPMFLAQGPAFNDLHPDTFLNAWAQYDAAAYSS